MNTRHRTVYWKSFPFFPQYTTRYHETSVSSYSTSVSAYQVYCILVLFSLFIIQVFVVICILLHHPWLWTEVYLKLYVMFSSIAISIHPSIIIHSAPTSSHDCNSQKVVYCCVFPSGWLSVRVLSLSLSPVKYNIWCTYERIINSMIYFHPSWISSYSQPHSRMTAISNGIVVDNTISWLLGFLVV